MSEPRPGRPRDSDIDARVLAEARRQMAAAGYQGLSVAGVAAAAQTSRQAVYRRWPSKADLATAAIADMSAAEERRPSEEPFEDLVTELEAFRRGISRPDGLSMIGTMLLGSTDPALVELFRERLVLPRRKRIVAILRRAERTGEIASGRDLELAAGMLVGSWYAQALAGRRAPGGWARRAAALAWRALGGADPG